MLPLFYSQMNKSLSLSIHHFPSFIPGNVMSKREMQRNTERRTEMEGREQSEAEEEEEKKW